MALSFALVWSLLSSVALAQQGPDPHEIRLKVGAFDPLEDELPVQLDLPTVTSHPQGTRGAYLVQFDHPISDADRAAIEAAGGSIKGYVPMYALEVVMTERERSAIQQLGGVRWVGVHQPSFKVKPGLLERAAEDPSARLKLQVTVFPGEGDLAAGALAGLGAQVLKVDRGRSYELFQLEIPAGRVNALAHIALVRYIEPLYTPMPHNDRGRAITGLNAVANYNFTSGIDTSLDGRDELLGFQVKYGHVDTGLYDQHADFTSASITFEGANDDKTDSGGHGTHTAGSIIGDGSQSSGVPVNPPGSTECGDSGCPSKLFRGMTPQGALHHISFESGYSDQQMISKEAAAGAHISTNSWGYVECKGPFCFSYEVIADYNANAAVWDEGVWDADFDSDGDSPLIVFFSAGNSGNGDNSGCGTNSGDQVGTPGAAKNVITVGGNEIDRGCNGDTRADNPDDVTYFSSRGPVDPDGSGRGLAKPDVTNVSTFVLSVEASGQGGGGWDDPNLCSDSGGFYQYMSGTSMSNPLTAGMGGLLLQDLYANLGLTGKLGRPSLIKGLLINGGEDMNPTGSCDYTFQDITGGSIAQGWGRVNAVNSLYGPSGSSSERNISFENEDHAVATSESYQTTIGVASNALPLKVTLVWTDYPAVAGSGSPLVVNDLDLQVVAPDGTTTYLGNNFSGNWSVTGGTADRYNVVENVYIQAPASGTYTIRVIGYSVSQDQDPSGIGNQQPFSLIWSGDLGEAGSVDNPPSVSITNPANGATVSGIITVTADAADDNGVSQVAFFVDGTSIGVDSDGSNGWSASWDTTGSVDGDHAVSAAATDTIGQTATSASITVTVDNVDDPPSVSITNPANGATVSGSITVTADATDDKGVSRVEFFVDSASIGVDSDGSDGWSASWNTTGFIDGLHEVSAVATDTNGLTATSASITVTVDNSAPAESHVGDLDGNGISAGNTWTAEVTITVHDGSHNLVADATVSGAWSGGASGSGSCATNSNGQCTVNVGGIHKRNSNVTFSVSNVTHSSLTPYNGTANHDPDGDSNGSSITVNKP